MKRETTKTEIDVAIDFENHAATSRSISDRATYRATYRATDAETFAATRATTLDATYGAIRKATR